MFHILYCSSFIGFLALTTYMFFQMNFIMNLVMSRKKHSLTGFFCWITLNMGDKCINVKEYSIPFTCSSLFLYLLEGCYHRFSYFLSLCLEHIHTYICISSLLLCLLFFYLIYEIINFDILIY